MGLTEEEKEEIERLFSKYDKSGNGKLEYDEFIEFMKEGLGNLNNYRSSEQLFYLYKGMDVDGSGNLSKDEIIECYTKLKDEDFRWISKMIFRGADSDNSKKVPIDKLKLACDGLGNSFEEKSFLEQCRLEFGEKKELEYWEFYKIISGETIDKRSIEADPYDGKLQAGSSKCCILI